MAGCGWPGKPSGGHGPLFLLAPRGKILFARRHRAEERSSHPSPVVDSKRPFTGTEQGLRDISRTSTRWSCRAISSSTSLATRSFGLTRREDVTVGSFIQRRLPHCNAASLEVPSRVPGSAHTKRAQRAPAGSRGQCPNTRHRGQIHESAGFRAIGWIVGDEHGTPNTVGAVQPTESWIAVPALSVAHAVATPALSVADAAIVSTDLPTTSLEISLARPSRAPLTRSGSSSSRFPAHVPRSASKARVPMRICPHTRSGCPADFRHMCPGRPR